MMRKHHKSDMTINITSQDDTGNPFLQKTTNISKGRQQKWIKTD